MTKNFEQPVSIKEVATFLGVHEISIHRYKSDPVNPLPSHKTKGRVWFLLSEVDTWMRSGDAMSANQIDALVDNIVANQ